MGKMLVCYPQKESQPLLISSGKLGLREIGGESLFELSITSRLQPTLVHLFSEESLAGIELHFGAQQKQKQCKHLCSVESKGSQIVIGDHETLGLPINQKLYLLSGLDSLAGKIVTHFDLQTRELADFIFEVATSEPGRLHTAISKYIVEELGTNPQGIMSCDSRRGDEEIGILRRAPSSVQVIETHHHGNFEVVAGYCSGRLATVWVVFDEKLLIDGQVSYVAKPYECLAETKSFSESVYWFSDSILGSEQDYKWPWWKTWT
ncbi:MAG: hypothetical protein AAF483_07305 [Planctomycetota bacterium]